MKVELHSCGLISKGDRVRLNPTSLTLASGQVTAVIGPNGAGKSTLMGLISGVIKPTHGYASLDDHVVKETRSQKLAQLRAVLSQDLAQSFGFTVYDVVSWARTPWRGTEHQGSDTQAIERALTSVGMQSSAERPIHQLSGGERQRVHLARVIAQDSPLFILDEPDSDLDLVGRNLLDSVVTGLNGSGKTILISSHDVNRISRIAHQAVVVSQQKMIFHGPIQQAVTSEVISEAFQSKIRVNWVDQPGEVQEANVTVIV
jgi:iron complex transport system ATP-binding protein